MNTPPQKDLGWNDCSWNGRAQKPVTKKPREDGDPTPKPPKNDSDKPADKPYPGAFPESTLPPPPAAHNDEPTAVVSDARKARSLVPPGTTPGRRHG